MSDRPYHVISPGTPARISLFAGAQGREPRQHASFPTLAHLARRFRKDSRSGDKRSVVLYSRGHALGGRERDDLYGPYLVILDVDGSDVSMVECSDRLAELGVAHFCHTTWSHDDEDPLDRWRYRVVTDLVADDWLTLAGITRELGSTIDVEIDPVSRHQICFYAPAAPEGRPVHRRERCDVETSWAPNPARWSDLKHEPQRGADGQPERDPDTIDVDELREALEAIPNESREQWVRTGQCLHASGLESARSLWDEWSSGQGYGAYSTEAQDATWGSFRDGGRLKVESIFWDARENGWRPPRQRARDQFGDSDADGNPPAGRSDLLAALSARYSYVSVGTGKVWDDQNDAFVSKSAFLDEYLNPTFETGRVRGGEPELEPIGRTWWNWDRRPTFSTVDFSPPGGPALGDGILNLWRGWGVGAPVGDDRPAEDQAAEWASQCGRLLDHVHEVVCMGNDDLFRWTVAWMAHLVQRPWEKPGTAIVMRSEEGTGKGFFARALVRMAGSHGLHVTQAGQLTGRFTQHLANKIVVFADEVTWGGRRQEEGVLKALITEPTMIVEAKGVDAIAARSYCRVLIASNHDWVVPAGRSARRYQMYDVSESRRLDRAYFGRLKHEIDGGGLAALHGFLLHVDLTAYPNPGQVVETRALLAQKLQGMDPVDAWMVDCLQAGQVSPHVAWEDEPFWVSKRFLYQSYLDSARDSGVTRRQAEMIVGMRIRKLLGGGNRLKARRAAADADDPSGMRPWEVLVPGLAAARALLDDYVGQSIEWTDD